VVAVYCVRVYAMPHIMAVVKVGTVVHIVPDCPAYKQQHRLHHQQ
jgi:hypothetical protein